MGYIAGSDIDLAVERGEVQCRAFTISTYFAREPFFTWRKNNFARVLHQTGSKRDAPAERRADVHDAHDPGTLARPFVLPPGIPRDRVQSCAKHSPAQ
jgi:hypothetical protein